MDNRIKRTVAALFAVTTAAASFSAWQNVPVPAEAKTLEEIEKEKKEKQEQINKKKEQLAVLADDLTKKAQYEQTLKEQIDLISGKMLLIDTQLQNLHVDMEDTEKQVAALEGDRVVIDAGGVTVNGQQYPNSRRILQGCRDAG